MKGVCKAMMKSQMCDNSSVGDILFLRAKNGRVEGVGKECEALWRSKVKCIQAWEIEDIWSYPDKCNVCAWWKVGVTQVRWVLTALPRNRQLFHRAEVPDTAFSLQKTKGH